MKHFRKKTNPPNEVENRSILKKIIHVNQHNIKRNAKYGTDDPVLTIKTYKQNDYAHEATIKTKDGLTVARVIYSPNVPLNCGARVWIELETENVDVEHFVREESWSGHLV